MVNDFENALAELDLQIGNLRKLDTSDHAIASGIAALSGKRAMLLAEYGQELIGESAKDLKKLKAKMTALKVQREEAKQEVVRTFNASAEAVKLLRDSEQSIKENHAETQAVLVEKNRTLGKPFQNSPPPRVHYRAIHGSSRLGALDNWYEKFATHFGKLATRIDAVIKIDKARFFDDG
jgi:hypothetical protein